jgi:O-antigen/teichoic acid export membrane protein
LSVALAAQLLVRTLGLASGIVVAASLARGLGHTQFGQFSLVLTLVGIATNLGDLGLTNTVVRELAVAPDREAETVGALVLARIATGVLGASFVLVAVVVLDPSPTVRLVGLLGAATLLLAPLGSLQAVGQAKLRIGAQNVLLALQSALWMVAVLVLAVLDAPLVAYGLLFFLTSAVQSVATWAMFRRSAPVSFADARAALARVLRVAAPLAVGGLLVTSYYRAGAVLLYHFRGPAETADYSAAYRFLDMLQIIPITLLTALLPLLSSTWRADTADAASRRDRLFGLSFASVALLALPTSVGGALVAEPLIHLVYGRDFAGAAPVLAVLLLSFPAICAGYIAVGLALASGRTALYAKVAGAVALLTIPANALLIPIGGGIATAWVTVVAEYAAAGTMLAALRRDTAVQLPVRSWIATAIATLLMALAIAPLRHLSPAISVPVGALVFGVAALALRAITITDLKRLVDRREEEWS